MSQVSRLIKRHRNLSQKVETLESERSLARTFEHKSELIKLKKEKLVAKEEITQTLKVLNDYIKTESVITG
jgi:uncharacterized protein YdcH (DUF465 family)